MTKLKLWLCRKYLEFKYRKIDHNVCCCGSSLSGTWCGSPYPCRSQKEYAITSELEKLEQGVNNENSKS